MAGIDQLIFRALNHLLRAESWATERLRAFAGTHALIQAGPLAIKLVIDEHGLLAPATGNSAPDVTITLPADTPIRFLLDRSSLFSSVRLSGSADVAEGLAFVFRHLRWDVEGDLASIIGDIPARRISVAGAAMVHQVIEGGRRLTENVVEYATEDSATLVPRREMDAFGNSVNALSDDLARLEKRIGRL